MSLLRRTRQALAERKRCPCGHLVIAEHDGDGCTVCPCERGRGPVTHQMSAHLKIKKEDLQG